MSRADRVATRAADRGIDVTTCNSARARVTSTVRRRPRPLMPSGPKLRRNLPFWSVRSASSPEGSRGVRFGTRSMRILLWSGSSAKRQVVHWHVTGAPGGGSDDYQTTMQHGSCAVSTSLDEEPRTELFMHGAEFLKVVTNNANPITLFMTRKLKVSGDVGFATALQKMFTIPSA